MVVIATVPYQYHKYHNKRIIIRDFSLRVFWGIPSELEGGML